MFTPHDILKQYWKFDQFRPKQLEIIETVLAKKDALALLPTGGGKSVCYQVPGLLMDGVCLVVSPLIALMEDQIRQLKAKNIPAVALNSTMSKRQIDMALDNAIYGSTKFLYVSPERLNSELFRVRFEKMKINLIAVDEAHCISEWGYNFRPSYLNIATLRKWQPNVPFLALTATATPDVIDDIQEKLEFKEKKVISQSFERKNLTYNTWLTNNKLNRIESFLKNKSDSGIIYCSTRKKVKNLCVKLLQSGYSVDYYHAGLPLEDRKAKQARWTNNEVRVMIATNAFGMGIDKPDVRFVLHHDIPMSLEAYFQEAGRGGRDGKPAVAHLFYEAEDLHDLQKRVELSYPPIETIKTIYNALGNHLQLAIGSGKNEQFPLDLAAFADKYNLNLITVYNALKFLELCNYIALSDNYKHPSKIRILGNNQTLYNYQVKEETLNKVILFLLRTEMGIYDDYVTVNEFKIASGTGLSPQVVRDKLAYLSQAGAVDYIPRSELPTLTYLTERLADNNMSISPQFYLNRKKIAFAKLASVTQFIVEAPCKSACLLAYFGELDPPKCGMCSGCLAASKTVEKSLRVQLKEMILALMDENRHVLVINLLAQFQSKNTAEILENLRWMADHQEIVMDEMGKSFIVK